MFMLPANIPSRIKRQIIIGYLLAAAFIVAAVMMMFSKPIKITMSCANKTDIYDCQVRTKAMLHSLSVNNFENVMQAVVAEQISPKGKKVYQVQLLNTKRDSLSFSNTWVDSRADFDMQVRAINKLFEKYANFNYNFGTKKSLIMLILVLWLFAILSIRRVRELLNSYGEGTFDAVKNADALKKVNESDATTLRRGFFGHDKNHISF